jgi:hypothetical protein
MWFGVGLFFGSKTSADIFSSAGIFRLCSKLLLKNMHSYLASRGVEISFFPQPLLKLLKVGLQLLLMGSVAPMRGAEISFFPQPLLKLLKVGLQSLQRAQLHP